jgi:Ca2+-binding RTX toxin-like protein
MECPVKGDRIMTVTITVRDSFNHYEPNQPVLFENAYNHAYNSIEAQILAAGVGRPFVDQNGNPIDTSGNALNPLPPTFVSSWGFLDLGDAVSDAPPGYIGSDSLKYAFGSGGSAQYGLLASRIEYRNPIGADAYRFTGLGVVGTYDVATPSAPNLFGTNEKITGFYGLDRSYYADTVLGPEIYNPNDNFGELVDVSSFDIYNVDFSDNHAIKWSGFDLDFVTFMDYAELYRAGDTASLMSLLNSYEYLFNGGQYADTMYGYAKGDTLNGNNGNDVLAGRDGDDTLNGGANDDTLWGDEGNDTLDGGAGNDQSNGGNGDDIIYLSAGADSINGGGGSDTIVFRTATVANFRNNIFTGDALGDTGWSNYEKIEGSSGDDTIITAATTRGVYYGMGGADRLEGGSAADWFFGGEGTDTLYGNGSLDWLVGDAGNDTLYGGDNNDRLQGGDDNDTLNGDAGNDRLEGGTGVDILNGGSGDDVIFSGAGNDTVNGGTEFDMVSYAGFTFGVPTLLDDSQFVVRVDLSIARSTEMVLITDEFDPSIVREQTVYTDTLLSIEGAIGGGGADTLIGNNIANRFEGAGGNDQIRGEGANDTLIGGAGSDNLWGGTGADIHTGGDDTALDFARYDDASYGDLSLRLDNATLNTGAAAVGDTYIGIEGLVGGLGNDVVVGDASANYLFGGGGLDFIDGLGGSDRLTGNAGADRFRMSTALGATNVDAITDFVHGTDDILLLQSIFAAIGTTLDATELRLGTAASDANDFVIYNSATGQLFYDANGNGAGGQTLFATVTAGTVLDTGDFVMV